MAQTALIIESILALLMLMKKHQDAKAVTKEQIDEALAEARRKFYENDPANLPEM